MNCNVIPPSAFEPSKNTTTQATQPLPAILPSILVPTPNSTPTPLTSAAASTALHCNTNSPIDGSLDDEEEPMEQYHIVVPSPLPGTLFRQALQAENMMV